MTDREGVHGVGRHQPGVPAARHRRRASEHLRVDRDRGERREVAHRRHVHRVLAEPRAGPIAGQETFRVRGEEVRPQRRRVHVVVAEILAGIADVGELPVDHEVLSVATDHQVRRLEVAVHEPEREWRRSVRVEPRRDVAQERVRLDVSGLGEPEAIDERPDVAVPARWLDQNAVEHAEVDVVDRRHRVDEVVGVTAVAAAEIIEAEIVEMRLQRPAGHVVEHDAPSAEVLAGVVVVARRGHGHRLGVAERAQHGPLLAAVGVHHRFAGRWVAPQHHGFAAAVRPRHLGARHDPAVPAGHRFVGGDRRATGPVLARQERGEPFVHRGRVVHR